MVYVVGHWTLEPLTFTTPIDELARYCSSAGSEMFPRASDAPETMAVTR